MSFLHVSHMWLPISSESQQFCLIVQEEEKFQQKNGD